MHLDMVESDTIECAEFTTYPVKLACVMVGLPARGKTIVRYLDWLGYPTRLFNVGNYRRETVGATQPHQFFDPTNEEYSRKRMELAMMALDDMVRWFEEQEEIAQKQALQAVQAAANASGTHRFDPITEYSEIRAGGSGFVAVYDATNSTIERRQLITNTCRKHRVQVMFVESFCDDLEIVYNNVREVKVSCPDYVGVDPKKAVQDFMHRIHHYEKVYATLTSEERVPFIKIINAGKQVQMSAIQGYLQSRIVSFLINLNITPRNIYFSRHGESELNVLGRIGGDSALSERGWTYADKLPEMFTEILHRSPKRKTSDSSNASPNANELLKNAVANSINVENGDSLKYLNVSPTPSQSSQTFNIPPTPIPNHGIERVTVWTSSLKRTMQTAYRLPFPKMQWKQLDEIDAGVCEGLTYQEIEEKYPEDFASRDRNKFNFRYKAGESYRDLVQRLEPVIMELERHHEPGHSIFIIGHQAVLRCIFAYFMNINQDQLPYIKIPLHTIVKLTPKAYECEERRFPIDVPAVDTYRPRISSPLALHDPIVREEIPETESS